MTERDAKLSARYRELASEEPSVVIDDAIRAAARRAVASRRASFERRWAAPVSIAAVLVLAVGVTLRMQLEQPGVEVPAVDSAAPGASLADRAQPPAAPAPAPAEADLQAKRKAPEAKPQAAPEPKLESRDFLRQKKDEPEQKPVPAPFPASTAGSVSTMAPAAPAAAAAPAPVPAPSTVTGLRKEEASAAVAPQLGAKAREAESGFSSDELAAGKVTANVAAPGRAGPATNATAPPPSEKAALGGMREAPSAGERAATPEKELERIAELRRAGRDAEADEALARFKREHPDYRIADEIWEQVRPR